MAIHYYDPIDGDDANDGLTELEPKKTWPTSGYTTGDTYAGKAGTAAVLSDKCNITVNDVTLTSYGGSERFKLDSTAQTADLARSVRIATDGTTIENIELTYSAEGGNGDCLTMLSGTGLTVRNCKFTGPDPARDNVGQAMFVSGTGPFVIENSEISGFNIGIQLSNCVPAGKSYIRYNVIRLLCHINQVSSSAAIFLNTNTGVTEWNYSLLIKNVHMSNWAENGIDFVDSVKAIAEDCTIGPDSGQYDGASGVFMGNTSGTAGYNIVRRCRFVGITGDPPGSSASGLNWRGGTNSLVYGCIFDSCKSGVKNTQAVAVDNVLSNCLFINNTDTDYEQTAGTAVIYNIISNSSAFNSIDIIGGTCTYSNCCTDNTISGGTDGGGNITDDPLLNNDYTLPENSPCIGTGAKWWTGPNPQGLDGEPFSDFATDMGPDQSTYSPLHPKNL